MIARAWSLVFGDGHSDGGGIKRVCEKAPYVQLGKKGHAAGRVEKGRGGGSGGTRWARSATQWRHGRSVKTASASSSQRTACRMEGPAAVVPTATEQRAAHETVGMQEYLRYASLR